MDGRPPKPASLADRYGVLLEAARALASTLELPELCEAIWEQTGRIVSAGGFYVSLYDAERDEATIVFFADQGRHERVNVSYRGADSRVISEGVALLVKDGLERRSLMLLGDAGRVTRSAISAPLKARGRVVGAISAQSYEPDAYTEADLELLAAIADLAAVAVVNARHVADLELRANEAGRVEEIGRALAASLDFDEVLRKVTDAVLDLLPADAASVWLLEGTVARVAASGGRAAMTVGLAWDVDGPIHARLAGRREMTRIDDLAVSDLVPHHLRDELAAGSWIAVPLVVGGAVAGFLTAGSGETRRFGPSDIRVLERLSAQAAVALQNARLHASVRALSLTDQLTGLANRRHFDIQLRQEVAAAYRGRTLALAVFDLDDFKGYNDARGHLAGDDILRAFAGVLQGRTRAMNLVARLGGDEFVSIITDSHPEGVAAYLDRIRAGLAEDPVLGDSGVTFTVGVAFYDPASMKSGQDLLQRADDDLYAKKAVRGESRSD